MRIQNTIVLSFVIALTMASPAPAQKTGAPAAPGEVGVGIALQIAGRPYGFDGSAKCTHAPVASIYEIAAELWGVEQHEKQRSVTLTLWRPKSGSGDMFNLYVTAGGKSYNVNTVRAGRGNSVRGSGTVTFKPAGSGGTFIIDAKTGNGAPITGTINCNGFSAAMAEGG